MDGGGGARAGFDGAKKGLKRWSRESANVDETVLKVRISL